MTSWNTLSTYTDDAILASGGTISHTEHNTHRTNVRDYLVAIRVEGIATERNHNNSSAPDDTNDGVLWSDSGNNLLKWRNGGAWKNIAITTNANTWTANQTLANAIDLLVATDGGSDLGATANRFGTIFVDAATITNNVTIGGNLELNSTNPVIWITDTNAPLDSGDWFINAFSSTLTFRAYNEARDTFSTWLNVVRSGSDVTSVTVPEGLFRIDDTTDSTSTTTGSIQTDGGLGIAKALFVGGLSNFADQMLVVEGTDLGATAWKAVDVARFGNSVELAGLRISMVKPVADTDSDINAIRLSYTPSITTLDLGDVNNSRAYFELGNLQNTQDFQYWEIGKNATNAAQGTVITHWDKAGNLLHGHRTTPTSLAGGIAMLNGTAASAALTNGISMWAEDDTAESHLVVMNEGLTKFHIGGGYSADEDVVVGGVLPDSLDFAQTARTTTGVLKSFTIPAGLLNAVNRGLKITAWGQYTGANAAWTIQVRTGTTPTTRDQLAGLTTTVFWSFTFYLFKISDTTAQFFIRGVGNRSNGDIDKNVGDTVEITTDTDWTAAQIVDINVSTINASDTITQEGLIVEIL